MGEQLHITHRDEYLRGRQEGQRDAQAGENYRPRDGAVGSQDRQRAYGLGYADGWDEGNPCTNGTCDHLAHREPYVADPLNPTDEELTAAVQRGLADGTLIDADEWLTRNAPR